MKKIFISLMFMMAACLGANAMSFERAQEEALYLTDKMAYELNLNDQQYNDAYEINLDYLLRVDSPSDIYGDYYSYRLGDLRSILHDWQYSLLMAADYFLRPIVWRAGVWYFPIYGRYNRGYFYYSRPTVWRTYYGGHSRAYHHRGFYADRRPVWNGGLRGHDMHHPHLSGSRVHHQGSQMHRPSSGSHRPSGIIGHSGSSSHHSSGSMHRGNSFDGSSSRMGGGHHGGTSFGGGLGGGHNGSSSFGGSHSGGHVGGSHIGGGSTRSGGHMGGGMSRGGSRGGRR